jgi:hypothetical protein
MPDKPNPTEPTPPDGQILIYQDGATRLQVRLEGRTVWLPQRLIAELFQVSVKTANEHLVNIYSEGELDPGATIRSFRIVQTEGAREVSRAIDHYSLDAIPFEEKMAEATELDATIRKNLEALDCGK